MATQSIPPDRIIIAVPGTSETSPTADPHVEIGMIGLATKFLSSELFEKYFLPYDSQFGDRVSYHESRNRAIARLIDMLLHYEGAEIFLIGYSQGAAIVTLAVKTMRKAVLADPEGNTAGAAALEKIKGIYLISNPHRQPGMIFGPDPGGEGIDFSPEDGWWGEMKDRVMEICAKNDIIGSSDPNTTFLKRLPKYLGDMNWANLIGWAQAVYHMMITSNPLTLYPELRKEFGILTYLSRYWNTARALYIYVSTNVHVMYGEYQIASQSVMRIISNDIIDKAVVKNAS